MNNNNNNINNKNNNNSNNNSNNNNKSTTVGPKYLHPSTACVESPCSLGKDTDKDGIGDDDVFEPLICDKKKISFSRDVKGADVVEKENFIGRTVLYSKCPIDNCPFQHPLTNN